ncbi:MAG TPA: CAP domain-containing protein [Candidatus Paceibacterota bacterium]|nr:CAP domain-containing protein [Candidatus Paceibacterota bacterium]
MRFFPLATVIVLAIIVVFVVPDRQGETIFDALKPAQTPSFPNLLVERQSLQNSSHSPIGSSSSAETAASSSSSQVRPVQTQTAPALASNAGTSSNDHVLSNEKTAEPVAPLPSPQSYEQLSAQGVLEWTNYYREQNGLPPLKLNSTLVTAATLKVYDMFQKQYFEHVSPDGKDISDVVTNLGYQYITVGENLALGDFVSSKDLVDAWMNSPGHRANILNKSYEEIGVALKYGKFNGRDVWLAAQEFGRPRSSCPMPDQNLKSQIEMDQDRTSDLSSQLDALHASLQQISKSDVSEYNAKIDEYNALAKQINQLNQTLKEFINEYNAQVETFNTCAAE